ncbi:Di-and tricarboxylate transporter [Rubritalea squalenifaciens DSM 18772]|uniref:Di-and tricarboxylate transporter n=1 Tax=Rubritalea squalenifaciens DSM 18772 TaxID=1123071 RepID=A0A1M6H209_9BACT|nr:SLC13 family permease [Rubritalea squalenifaciens]SHJ16231.1 Di-and tricarboxylate transporter [Rubritalea squalenifaciens DSM 18772]
MAMFETWQQIFLAVLTVLVFGAFVKEWLSAELVALVALVACVFAGVLSVKPGETNNALLVFAHPAPITVACMFILSAALERTGVIESLGVWFEKVAGSSPMRMLVMLMLIVVGLSGFVNNTPVVVVFMPIIMGICRRKNYKASRFLIPLSYAAVAGGTMTIIGTSTNLVAAGIASKSMTPFTMFEITPMGLIFAGITMVYMLTLGRKLLPDRVTLAALIDSDTGREFITHAFVKEGSPLAGKLFPDTEISKLKKARVLEVVRDGERLRCPLPEVKFEVGDEIIFKGVIEGLMGISDTEGIDIRGNEKFGLGDIRTESAVLMEGILGPESSLAGKNLKELNFRQRFGVIILAVHRRGRNLREKFEDERLAFGDTLLVQGPRERMRRLFQQKDFINLSEPKHQVLRTRKAPIVLAALGLFVIMGALGGNFGIPQLPTVQLALASALLVLVTRCLDPHEAFQSIEWKVIFMICGMLGLGMAMDQSGLAANIAKCTVGVIGHDNPYLMLSVFYLLSAILTELISNNAVAALLTPLGMYVASQMGVDARPFVVAVMFGASASFSTPIGYQTNTFVYGAGGYKFGDFFRVGFPLAVILWLTASLVIPILWPF